MLSFQRLPPQFRIRNEYNCGVFLWKVAAFRSKLKKQRLQADGLSWRGSADSVVSTRQKVKVQEPLASNDGISWIWEYTAV